MADVLVPAALILDAIPRATSALQSTPTLLRGAWPRQEQMLAEMKAAADLTIQLRFSPLTSLTAIEASVIGPYLKR